MDKQNLLGIFTDLKQKVKVSQKVGDKQRTRLVQTLDQLLEEYTHLEIQDETLFEALQKKGQTVVKELKKEEGRAAYENLTAYLRYAEAAVYDFKRDLSGLNYFIRSFLVTAMLFMALSPQYFGFMLPAVFLVPVFLGLRGSKQRSRTGWMMALAVVPVGVLVGVTWVRYGLYALANFQQVVSDTAAQLNRSVEFAKAVVIIPSFLGAVLIVMAILTAYFGYKYKKLFI